MQPCGRSKPMESAIFLSFVLGRPNGRARRESIRGGVVPKTLRFLALESPANSPFGLGQFGVRKPFVFRTLSHHAACIIKRRKHLK